MHNTFFSYWHFIFEYFVPRSCGLGFPLLQVGEVQSVTLDPGFKDTGLGGERTGFHFRCPFPRVECLPLHHYTSHIHSKAGEAGDD